MRRVAAALLHYPVVDRQRAVVTTAITNLDLHDIARSALSYGLSDFFIVHPVAAQRELALRVRNHWVDGSGATRIPDRKLAMELLRIVSRLEEAVDALDGAVELWTTSASAPERPRPQLRPGDLSFAEARERLCSPGKPVLICFGTGWGLADSVLAQADYRLCPVPSPREDGYNHLSVRAAAAIIFDRLLGTR